MVLITSSMVNKKLQTKLLLVDTNDSRYTGLHQWILETNGIKLFAILQLQFHTHSASYQELLENRPPLKFNFRGNLFSNISR